ncbi:hypothetical protein AVEN_103720-1 [Araneus ventricosus]|uniref:Uncharacterized protein n=1 Tax=Araneus ventricosus TaxID=182803 RepID=A0A4Y2NFF9_ARAVE|nr:hypothetical protein AVEN_103720-1 [Araneus ventricosus]
MDSSVPFSLFSSLLVVGNMNARSFISPLTVPLMTTRPTAFCPLSEQHSAETRPASMEVAWTVTAGLRVRVLIVLDSIRPSILALSYPLLFLEQNFYA